MNTDYYTKQSIIKLFKNLSSRFDSKEKLSQNDYLEIFELLLDAVNMPLPEKPILDFFLQEGLLKKLILDIHNSDYLFYDDRTEIKNEFMSIFKKFNEFRTGEELTFRILGNKGTYPNCQIKRGKINFANYHFRPNLITINSISQENQYKNDSSIYWLSRLELKFAISLVCTGDYAGFFPYFNSHDTISINTSYLKTIPEDQLFRFLNELMCFQNRFIRPDGQKFNRDPLPDITTYNYSSFNSTQSSFNKVFDNFSIRDHLLLRTSNYLIKGLMHRSNSLFAEEAITNIFFALEGCLHLLQRKYGDNSKKLNLKLLKEIFEKKLTYLPDSLGTFEFIQGGYSTRISLVHPEPQWGAEWNPYVDFEDFRDYFWISKMILNWVICEREVEI